MKFIKKIIIFSMLLEAFSANVYAAVDNNKIIGHRGASGLAPENTVAAFERAAQIGMWGIESDLYVLRDGNIVMFHDETVDRMTNGCGNIIDMTLEEVKALTIDNGNYIENYKGLKIPTFDEYLNCCKRNNLVPIIEFKIVNEESVKEIINKIKIYDLEKDTVIISTDAKWIKHIRKYSNKIEFQYLADITIGNINLIKKYGNCGMDINISKLTKEKIDLAHSNNCRVNVWTVNNEKDIKELFNLGVDMITSDFIGEVR